MDKLPGKINIPGNQKNTNKKTEDFSQHESIRGLELSIGDTEEKVNYELVSFLA